MGTGAISGEGVVGVATASPVTMTSVQKRQLLFT